MNNFIVAKGALMVGVLLVSGCATVFQGTTDEISIVTDPEGAACDLQREGRSVGYLNATPGIVTVPRDKDSIGVECRLDGYQNARLDVDSEFTAHTVGNVLLGGGIGIVVDAATGANSNYPDEVTLHFFPAHFDTVAERDAVFAEHESRLHADAEARISAIQRGCGEHNKLSCESRIDEAQARLDKSLAALARQRDAAQIGNEATRSAAASD